MGEKRQNGRTECTEKEKSGGRERRPGGNELVGFAMVYGRRPRFNRIENDFWGLILCTQRVWG